MFMQKVRLFPSCLQDFENKTCKRKWLEKPSFESENGISLSLWQTDRKGKAGNSAKCALSPLDLADGLLIFVGD